MPRNKSHNQPYKQSVQHNEHHQVLGELKSIDRAVARIVTLVDGLDHKIDALTPAVKLATVFDRPLRTSEAHAPAVMIDAEEHNYYARLQNSLAKDGDDILMPLRDHSNHLVSSFPRTLARLAFIYEDGELSEMLKCFRIKHTTFTAHQAFCDFVGVNFAFALHTMNTYSFETTPTVAETRELRERLRASAVRYAAPPVRGSARIIEKLNAHARAENGETLFQLVPLRDQWSLVVPSFPTDLFELFNPVYQMDVRFLLREYGQSDEREGCEKRWVEFVGVEWALREYWVQDELVFHRYTAV